MEPNSHSLVTEQVLEDPERAVFYATLQLLGFTYLLEFFDSVQLFRSNGRGHWIKVRLYTAHRNVEVRWPRAPKGSFVDSRESDVCNPMTLKTITDIMQEFGYDP